MENEELDRFIHQTVKTYTDAENVFLDLVFEMGDQEGMTKQDAKDFIAYLGELRKYQLGLLSAEEVRENPLPWMDYLLSGSTHSNFFETRVVDYTHNGLSGSVDYSKYQKAFEERIYEGG